MTRDDIIRMAREAEYTIENIDGIDEVMDGDGWHTQTYFIARFAVLVAAAERETCAELCEKIIIDCRYEGEAKNVAEFLADEIRWRVENEIEDMRWMKKNELKQEGDK